MKTALLARESTAEVLVARHKREPRTVRTEMTVPWEDGEQAIGWVEALHAQRVRLAEADPDVQALVSYEDTIAGCDPANMALDLLEQIEAAEKAIAAEHECGCERPTCACTGYGVRR